MMKFFLKKRLELRLTFLLSISFGFLLLLLSAKKEEGMFPLSYLDVPTLQKAGLKLNKEDIFNPGEVALTHALVKLGGCTGSFISEQGLIITNHHCVYGEVSKQSTSEQNYLENGFVANSKEKEIPVNIPCKITVDYSDVSAQVLMGVSSSMTPAEQALLISSNIEAIKKTEQEKHPELLIEVSEMFVGKSYTLFKYIFLQDVRLVFVPPLTVGQFGGDLDNWEWPRHNGDFSIVRVYVGKDGKPAKYHPDNVPYQPANHLKINTAGTKEGDFVFIMGYPGRTFRHETAAYMKFMENFHLPEVSQWYAWKIKKMYESSSRDTTRFLKYAGSIQSLSNVEKNYRGKIQGLKRTQLVKQKYLDEEAMVAHYGGNTSDMNKILGNIYSYWTFKEEMAKEYYYLKWLYESEIGFASTLIYDFKQKIKIINKDTSIKDKKLAISDYHQRFIQELKKNYSILDPIYEKEVANELMNKLMRIDKKFKKHFKFFSNDKCWEELIHKSLYFKPDELLKKAENIDWLTNYKDDLNHIGDAITANLLPLEKKWEQYDLQLKAEMPLYLNYKEQYKSSQFIPDANSTLRLTYGFIKGYNPNGNRFYPPYTYLEEMYSKANTAPDYRLPDQVADNLRIDNPIPLFKDPKSGKVVVCILYNLDTTGGNSGSPVLDAQGQLVGINFDRSFTATINDYAWNESYSRSIGVDIRYVLYVMKYVGKANNLFAEMGVNL